MFLTIGEAYANMKELKLSTFYKVLICLLFCHTLLNADIHVSDFGRMKTHCSWAIHQLQDPGIGRATLQLYTTQLLQGLYNKSFDVKATSFSISNEVFQGDVFCGFDLTFPPYILPPPLVELTDQERCHKCLELFKDFLMNTLCILNIGAYGACRYCNIYYTLETARDPDVCPDPYFGL